MVVRLILLFGSITLMFIAIFVGWNLAIIMPIVILGFVMIPFSTVLSGMNLNQFRILGGIKFNDLIKLLSNHNHFKNPATKSATDVASFAELEKLKAGAGQIYQSNILPFRNELESIRHEKIDIFSKRLFYSCIASIFVVTGFIFIGLYQLDTQIALFSLFILSIIFWWAFAPARDYKALIKDKVFSQFIKFVDVNSSYNPEGNNIVSKIAYTGILPNYDDANDEDNINLNYEDVKIEVEEVVLKRDQGSGKNRRRVTVFCGLIVIAQMNKNFSGKTVVKADSGSIGNWFQEKFSNLQKVSLEDPNFEKTFEVYSDNQVEARYLLTTAFMERIQKLRDYFTEVAGAGKGDFQFSFFEEKLVLMIPCGKNMFEPHPLTEPAIQVSEIVNFITELQYIFAIIEQLKLNMKIGL